MKIDTLEDDYKSEVDNNYIKEYKDKFGKDPNIIGMFWNSPDKVIDGIIEAIESGEPYDEYEMLSDKEKKAFDNGELLF